MSSFVRLVTVGFVCFIGKTFIQAAPLFEDETPVEVTMGISITSLILANISAVLPVASSSDRAFTGS